MFLISKDLRKVRRDHVTQREKKTAEYEGRTSKENVSDATKRNRSSSANKSARNNLGNLVRAKIAAVAIRI